MWPRSLIRDSSSQGETSHFITTRIPPARAKWDGGKEMEEERRTTDHLEDGMKVKEKRLEPLLASEQHGSVVKGMRAGRGRVSTDQK